MATTSEVPVLIVGGGSSGLMLSLQLSRYGVASRTIDRLPKPGETSKAITVHARMLEIFECIDEKLLKRFLQRGIISKGYVLHYVKDGQRSEVRPGIDFTKVDSEYPYILVHRQDETEKFIREYWQEEYGGEVEWGTRLTNVVQDDDGVTSTVIHTDKNNAEEIIKSKYVIACDGINSQVRRCLNVEQDESGYEGTVLQNMDVRLKNFPDTDEYIHYCTGTGHFMMVAKLPGDYFRLLVSDRGEAADPNIEPRQAFQNLLDLHFDGIELGEIIWHTKWETWVRLAKSYRQNNIFLVGDSAHVHSTNGGQGMNCCIQDAYNLGWKLGMVESGLANRGLLDSYEEERRPIAEQVIWAASSLHDIFMGHGNDIAMRSEKIAEQEYLHKVVDCCAGITYTYRDYVAKHPGLNLLPGPQIGDRAPDIKFDDGMSLFKSITHTRYTLFIVSAIEQAESIDEDFLKIIETEFSRTVKCEVINNSTKFNERYELDSGCRLYLIRPDGYIGFCCLAEEAEYLLQYLRATIQLIG